MSCTKACSEMHTYEPGCELSPVGAEVDRLRDIERAAREFLAAWDGVYGEPYDFESQEKRLRDALNRKPHLTGCELHIESDLEAVWRHFARAWADTWRAMLPALEHAVRQLRDSGLIEPEVRRLSPDELIAQARANRSTGPAPRPLDPRRKRR